MTDRSDPFPHRPTALSDQARAALPEVQWEAFLAPAFRNLQSTNTVGVWHIGHPRSARTSLEPVELSYQLPMEEGETYATLAQEMKGLSPADLRWWECFAKTSKTDLGFVYDSEYAMVFVDRALRHPPRKPAEQVLLEGGFEFDHEFDRQGEKIRSYRKKDAKGGMFSVFLSDSSLWMTHEKRTARYWTNLLSLGTKSEGASGDPLPRFFSPLIEDPIASAADMAVYFTQHWQPSLRVQKSEEQAPAPRRKGP